MYGACARGSKKISITCMEGGCLTWTPTHHISLTLIVPCLSISNVKSSPFTMCVVVKGLTVPDTQCSIPDA